MVELLISVRFEFFICVDPAISYTQREMAPHLPQIDVVLKFEVIELKKNMLKLKSVS